MAANPEVLEQEKLGVLNLSIGVGGHFGCRTLSETKLHTLM